jgi:hypothetical protein
MPGRGRQPRAQPGRGQRRGQVGHALAQRLAQHQHRPAGQQQAEQQVEPADPGQRPRRAAGQRAEHPIAQHAPEMVRRQRRAGEAPQHAPPGPLPGGGLGQHEGRAHGAAMRRAGGEPGKEQPQQHRRQRIRAEGGQVVQAVGEHGPCLEQVAFRWNQLSA